MGKYYVYRHIRLDKNEVFYVGIGTKTKNNAKSIKSIYGRAYVYGKNSRSAWWKRIYNKTPIQVDIIWESDNYDEVKQKEIEFIQLYGRQDLRKGTLVNMTDGGDGVINRIVRDKQKNRLKNSPRNPVYVYDKFGKLIDEFPNYTRAEKTLGLSKGYIYQYLKTNNHIKLEYRFFKDFQGLNIEPNYTIACGDINNVPIKKFFKVSEAALEFSVKTQNIHRALKNKNCKSCGYYWWYLHEDVSQIKRIKPPPSKKLVQVYVYSSEGKYLFKHLGVSSLSKKLNIHKQEISNVLCGRKLHYKKYVFKYLYEGDTIPKVFTGIKAVLKVDINNNVIKKYNSYDEAAIDCGRIKQTIIDRCKQPNKLYENYYWKTEI